MVVKNLSLCFFPGTSSNVDFENYMDGSIHEGDLDTQMTSEEKAQYRRQQGLKLKKFKNGPQRPRKKTSPGVRIRSSRLWRVSSFHFLSLKCPSVTVWILWLSFLAAVLRPAQRQGKPFLSGCRIFCLPWPPTPRISEPRRLTLSHLAARRRGLPQPIQSH